MTTELRLPGLATEEQIRATAAKMAAEFEVCIAEIQDSIRRLHAATDRMALAFRDEPSSLSRPFSLDVRYHGSRRDVYGVDDISREMERRAWQLIIGRLGIRSVMGIAKQDQLNRQLESGELPRFTETAIVGLILGLADEADSFARDAVREVFDYLRPAPGTVRAEYATNKRFYVGRKVVLVNVLSSRRRIHSSQEVRLLAIDSVMRVLDGRTPIQNRHGELSEAIGRGDTETEYFKFKCFKNGNLHLEFKRLDLVQRLNQIATGDLVIGDE